MDGRKIHGKAAIVSRHRARTVECSSREDGHGPQPAQRAAVLAARRRRPATLRHRRRRRRRPADAVQHRHQVLPHHHHGHPPTPPLLRDAAGMDPLAGARLPAHVPVAAGGRRDGPPAAHGDGLPPQLQVPPLRRRKRRRRRPPRCRRAQPRRRGLLSVPRQGRQEVGAPRLRHHRVQRQRRAPREAHGEAERRRAVGGKLYYELSPRELGVVELDNRDDGDDGEPRLTCVRVDMVDLPDDRPLRSTYLVESRGELYLVVVFFQGFDARTVAEPAVYKMDFPSPSSPAAWRRVGGIGRDRVFLLGGDSCGMSSFGASCSAGEHRLRGNTVYFVNHVAVEENALHVFDMERRTHTVQRPLHDFPRPLRPPFWMMLTDS